MQVTGKTACARLQPARITAAFKCAARAQLALDSGYPLHRHHQPPATRAMERDFASQILRALDAWSKAASVNYAGGYIFLIAVAVFSLYTYSQKPDCREGFLPVMGFGQGWYCAPGYKPQ